MSWFENVSPKFPTSERAKPALDAAAMAQLGAMSPLWLLFLGASTAGMAYWSMTRWMRLATQDPLVQPGFKLRLVDTSPEPDAVQPADVVQTVQPVEADVAAVPTVMPEAVAETAAAIAPDVVKVTPAPKVAKPKPVASIKSSVAKTEPVAAKPVAVQPEAVKAVVAPPVAKPKLKTVKNISPAALAVEAPRKAKRVKTRG